MKKFTKIMLAIAGICIALGTILMLVTGLTGEVFYGKADINIGPEGIELTDLPEDLAELVEDGGDWLEDEIEATIANYADSEKMIGIHSDTQIRDLDFSVKAVSLHIVRETDADEIMIKDGPKTVEVIHSVDENTLHLTIRRKEEYKNIGNSGDVQVTLVIPADMKFDEVELSMNAADVEVEGLVAEEIGLDLNAASGSFKNMEVTSLEVDNNASALEFHGDVKRVLDVDCNAGDVEMRLNGAYSDFNYKMNSKAGAIRVGDREYSGLKEDAVVKHEAAKKTAELECNVGSIDIQFTE